MSEAGHNSKEQLKSIIERVEAIEVEIRERQSDRTDIYKEAGGNGFDIPALKAIVRTRREDPAKRQEREAHYETYRTTLGID